MALIYKGAGILFYRFRPDGQPTLFLFRRKYDRGNGLYSLPGGGRNKNDRSFEDCATRETYEEIDIRINPEQLRSQMRIFLIFFKLEKFFR